jgi:ferredoxin
MRVRIDAENCVVTAPSAFVLDAEGKARLIELAVIDDETLWTVAELCPTEAIVLESDDGETLYP